MGINVHFSFWDWSLLIAVSLMGTVLSYLHHPKWKALILSLPVPFTLASLSLGRNVDATHMMGLWFLVIYTQGVRFLYQRLKVPIILAIGVSAGIYALLASLLAPRIPRTEPVFWGVTAGVFLTAVVLLRWMPHRIEPGHRTPLPIWIKLPAVAGVIVLLILAKKILQGFMAMFPMVGLVAAYEARHSLWTVCRAIPQFTLWMVPAMSTIHLLEPRWGLPVALAAGWGVYLMLLIPFTLRHWREIDDAETEAEIRAGSPMSGAVPHAARLPNNPPEGDSIGRCRPGPTYFYYVLPGTGIYGGVKKGFHCADLLTRSGYPCAVATPDGARAAWFDHQASVLTHAELVRRCRRTDAILFSCPADAPFVDGLPAERKILHMQGANTPGDAEMIDPARGYECISHGLHMTYQLQTRGRVAPYVAMGIPEIFRWRGIPKVSGRIAVMPRKGEGVFRALQSLLPQADFQIIDQLTEAETAAHLREADLFLAISENEALGLPPLEAMCAGCCVVGFSGVGGFEFMRHRETAFVVPNGDVEGLAAAVRGLLGNPAIRDALRQEGMELSKYYTLERERRYLLRALGLTDRPEPTPTAS